jgi:hypothetical protein
MKRGKTLNNFFVFKYRPRSTINTIFEFVNPTLYYILRKGTQPKIHETYNFSLNLFGILPYIFHEGYGM